MIRIGLAAGERQAVIEEYIREHSIERLYIFFFKKFPLEYEITGLPVEHVEYADIQMYKYFYRLLEEINERTLLVYDGCLRTGNRSDLNYNCAHHYSNQTPHNIVFEYLPFIEDLSDFMILLDYQEPGKYKGKGFDSDFLRSADVRVKPVRFSVESLDVFVTEGERAKYERKKEYLFDSLGEGDPDTIPRQLHVFAGNFKKQHLLPDVRYIARNARFKTGNVTVYSDAERGDYTVIDFAHRRLDFNDFLKRTGMTRIRFLNTGLPVDVYYFGELECWIERLEEFYASASLY